MPVPRPTPTDADHAYLAALIDGEGCLSPCVQKNGDRQTYTTRITIRMCDRQPLAWCHKTFGGRLHLLPQRDEYQPQWSWVLVRQQDVVRVLSGALPWILGKRPQVIAAIDLAQHLGDRLPHGNATQDPARQAANEEWRDRRQRLEGRLRGARQVQEVLAVDPGERVGWARASITPTGEWIDMRHGITPLKDFAMALAQQAPAYDVVVVEDWRLQPNKAHSFIGSSFPSVQFVGMVKLLTWVNPHVKLVTQQPSERNLANKPMKALRPDLYDLVTKPISHDDGHDQDALKHLFYWTWRNCEVPIS